MLATPTMFRPRAVRIAIALTLAALPAALISARDATRDAVHQQPGRAPAPARAATFNVEEATIADVHRAIQQGATTCKAIVQAYIDRAHAYNGTCTQLVTRDGASVGPASGPVRAGAAISFPAA